MASVYKDIQANGDVLIKSKIAKGADGKWVYGTPVKIGKIQYLTNKQIADAILKLKHDLTFNKISPPKPKQSLISDLLDEWIKYQKIEASEPTSNICRQRTMDLRNWYGHLTPQEFTADLAIQYKEKLLAEISSPQPKHFSVPKNLGGVKMRLAKSRMFFNWLIETKEILEKSPLKKIKYPKPDKAGRICQPEEFAALRAKCGKPLFWTLAELSFTTGMRPGELCGLHKSHVIRKPEGYFIKIIVTVAKTRSERTFPIPPHLVERIVGQEDKETGYYFAGFLQEKNKPSKKPMPMRDRIYQSVNNYWQDLKRHAGIVERLRLQDLGRHSFITYASSGGNEWGAIQKFTGHTDAKMAMVYDHTVIRRQMELGAYMSDLAIKMGNTPLVVPALPAGEVLEHRNDGFGADLGARYNQKVIESAL